MRLGFALAMALSAALSGVLATAAESPIDAPATLDVVVEDSRGRIVETLAPSDFVVTEQALPVPVESVRFVRATARSTPSVVPVSAGGQTPGTDSTAEVVAIYLDEFHVQPGPAAERVRSALVRFVNDEVDPTARLVVLKPLDSLLDIRPTSDRREAIEAIESFNPRRGDYTPRTSFERNFIAGTPARVESARAQIATSSLEALALQLGKLSAGRKTVIVVSQGFTRTRRRGDDLLPSLESVVLAANRAHVSIYPLEVPDDDQAGSADAGQGSAADQARWREALQSLADSTCGKTITAAGGDVSAGLRRALGDSQGYYELRLSTRDGIRDGRFHAVDVSIRKPGLTARSRKGYWAPSDAPTWSAAIAAASALPPTAALVRRTSPLIRPWFGISKSADGQTQVNFVWEPAPRVPGDRNPPPALAQVGLSVMTIDGKPVYQGVVFPSSNAAGDPGSAGLSQASFVTPSGRLVVQMSIQDVTSRVVDREVRDLEVRGFPGPVSMGSPQVMRARSAREYQALAADPGATPVASRQFSRAERLLIRIPVFSSGATPVVTARLLSGFGSAMRELTIVPTPSRSNEYQVDVPLSALATGSYSVEWTARTPEGQVRDTVQFRVTP